MTTISGGLFSTPPPWGAAAGLSEQAGRLAYEPEELLSPPYGSKAEKPPESAYTEAFPSVNGFLYLDLLDGLNGNRIALDDYAVAPSVSIQVAVPEAVHVDGVSLHPFADIDAIPEVDGIAVMYGCRVVLETNRFAWTKEGAAGQQKNIVY